MTGHGLPERKSPWRNLYGRRHGKKLKPNQVRLIETLLPRLAVPMVSTLENPARAPVAPIFPDGRPLWLEVGFGGGEHMVHQAVENPCVGVIGCEPFVNGVAMALNRIDRAGATENVRLHPGDARDLIELLPDGALERVFLLYPDPWPKARHVRRRFVNPENLALLARAMAPGAELRVATDVPDYADHTRSVGDEAPGFRRVPRDESQAWEGWPGTRYEAKALQAGRVPQYITLVRVE